MSCQSWMSNTMIPIKAVVAMNNNRVIGIDNGLPWHIPADLHHFKAQTQGRVVIMGHKTYQSIGKALPNRITIVLTRDEELTLPDALVVHTFERAHALALDIAPTSRVPEIVIAGGGHIYRLFLPVTDEIVVTKINNDWDWKGSTYFPTTNDFKVLGYRKKQYVPGTDRRGNPCQFEVSFQTWERK